MVGTIDPKSTIGALGATYNSTYNMGVGGAGGSGSVYGIPNIITSTGTYTYPASISSPLVINHNGTQIDVAQTLVMIMDRLCIIEPSFELHDKYPALREAYEAYKSLEALCKSGEKDE